MGNDATHTGSLEPAGAITLHAVIFVACLVLGCAAFFWLTPGVDGILLWIIELLGKGFAMTCGGVAELWNWTFDLFDTDVILALVMILVSLVLSVVMFIIGAILLVITFIVWLFTLSPLTCGLVGLVLGCMFGIVIWVVAMPILWILLSWLLKVTLTVAAYLGAGTIGAYAQRRYSARWREAMFGEVQARYQDPQYLMLSLVCGAISGFFILASALGWI
jgi:hypothetical protein